MLFQNYPDNVVFLYSKTLNVKVDYKLNPCVYRIARQGDDRDGAGAGPLPLQIQAQVQPRQDRHHDRSGRCLNDHPLYPHYESHHPELHFSDWSERCGRALGNPYLFVTS